MRPPIATTWSTSAPATPTPSPTTRTPWAPQNLLGERTGVYLWDYDRNLAVPGDTDAFLPEGYRSVIADLRIHITADPAQNVLNVVYDQKRNDLGYTVNSLQG